MGVHKGQNNFEKAQREKIETGKRRIENVLSKIKKGMVFKNLNSLIVHISDETTIHRTTLKRNQEYLDMAAQFFTAQPGAARFVDQDHCTAIAASVKDRANKARIKILETEVKRLKLAVERSARPQLSENNVINSAARDSENGRKCSDHLSDLDFSETAMTLLLLVRHLEKKEIGITLDREKQQIIDEAEIGDKKIVVPPNRCHAFFRWLNAQSKTKAILEQFAFED